MDKRVNSKEGEEYDIPEDGSLGLLALGHIGLKLWREKKKNAPRFEE